MHPVFRMTTPKSALTSSETYYYYYSSSIYGSHEFPSVLFLFFEAGQGKTGGQGAPEEKHAQDEKRQKAEQTGAPRSIKRAMQQSVPRQAHGQKGHQTKAAETNAVERSEI